MYDLTSIDRPNAISAHDTSCQCHSGAKCICGTSQESDELRLDTTKQTLHDARAKPKLMTTQSESHLTVFANGHHKPCHRNNNSAHVSGAPYKIPRPHTLHGHAAFASLAQPGSSYTANSRPEPQTTRSMDTLSLSNNDFYAMFGSSQRSDDVFPATTMAASLDASSFQDAMFSNQSNMFSSDSNSPESSTGDAFSAQQWPWTTTNVDSVNGTFPFGSLSTSPSQDCLPNLGNDWAIPSASIDPLWSAGDLPLDPSKFDDSLTQPLSHSGESKQSGPGLTAASSIHSEVGDANLFGDLDIKPPQSAASESLFWEDNPAYRFNPSIPPGNLSAPGPMPATTLSDIQSLESSYGKGLSAAPTSIPSTMTSDFADTAAIAMPSTIDDNIAIDPWPIEQNGAPFGALNPFELYNNQWF